MAASKFRAGISNLRSHKACDVITRPCPNSKGLVKLPLKLRYGLMITSL